MSPPPSFTGPRHVLLPAGFKLDSRIFLFGLHTAVIDRVSLLDPKDKAHTSAHYCCSSNPHHHRSHRVGFGPNARARARMSPPLATQGQYPMLHPLRRAVWCVVVPDSQGDRHQPYAEYAATETGVGTKFNTLYPALQVCVKRRPSQALIGLDVRSVVQLPNPISCMNPNFKNFDRDYLMEGLHTVVG